MISYLIDDPGFPVLYYANVIRQNTYERCFTFLEGVHRYE